MGLDPLSMTQAANRDEWRAWLRDHHAKAAHVWLVFFKKHTGKPTVTYEEAVEEALCFGWIDSVVRRLDDECYAQKFSPRRKGSQWSDSNRRRVANLIELDKMEPAGLATLEDPSWSAPAASQPVEQLEIHPEFRSALQASPDALERFNGLAPGYRRDFIRWVGDAKRPETRTRRILEAIAMLHRNEKLGMK